MIYRCTLWVVVIIISYGAQCSLNIIIIMDAAAVSKYLRLYQLMIALSIYSEQNHRKGNHCRNIARHVKVTTFLRFLCADCFADKREKKHIVALSTSLYIGQDRFFGRFFFEYLAHISKNKSDKKPPINERNFLTSYVIPERLKKT